MVPRFTLFCDFSNIGFATAVAITTRQMIYNQIPRPYDIFDFTINIFAFGHYNHKHIIMFILCVSYLLCIQSRIIIFIHRYHYYLIHNFI